VPSTAVSSTGEASRRSRGRGDRLTAQAVDLRVAIGRVARRMRQVYAASDGGPSFLELAVLLRLEREGPVTPTELAGRERVTSQAVAIVVRALGQRSLVIRSPSPRDGRSTVITITAAGIAVLRDREQTVVTELLRALGESCTPQEVQQLADVVPLLNRLAESI
jgi:DNA-binding MarR family transcriptional regulator